MLENSCKYYHCYFNKQISQINCIIMEYKTYFSCKYTKIIKSHILNTLKFEHD